MHLNRAPAIHQLCCIVLYRCCIGLLYRHRINEELLSDVGAGRLLYRCCIALYRCCIALLYPLRSRLLYHNRRDRLSAHKCCWYHH